MATTPYQIEIMKDIMNVSKIKTIDMTTHFNSLVLTLQNTSEIEDIHEDETLPIYQPGHLVRYLKDTNQKITQLELDCLHEILSQGSFYEESCSYDKEKEQYYVDGSACIGWEITEKEVKGCRGAISSLQKKGILDIGYDDVNGEEMSFYCIKHTLDFTKDGYHHLDIPAEFIK